MFDQTARAWAIDFARFFSTAVIGLAITVLAGHLFGSPSLYTWRGAGATAIPTATMNLCLGVAVLLLALVMKDDES